MEENTIFIGNKPVMNYVLAVVTQFNQYNTVTLRARGKAISRAVDTAEIVRNSFVQEAYVEDIQISTEEVENYTIDGFDLSAPGNVDVTVNFGAASANLQVEAINISDEIAAALAIDGITDPVPGLSVGAQDFVFSAYYQELMIVQEENVAMADALAQYKADLLAANYTLVYESEEGMHFISENKQLYLNVVNYYDIAIDVVINDVRMDAPATTDSVMCKVLQGLFGDQYGWEDFIQNEIPKPQENDGWYFFTKYSTSGSQANFARYIAAFEYYYMPSYMVPTCDAFELVYEDAPSIERDYMSPDGKVALRAIFNLWGTNLYLDIFTSYIA